MLLFLVTVEDTHYIQHMSLNVSLIGVSLSTWILIVLPKQTYLMLYGLDNVNRTSWVTNVKNILFRYGFGYAWIVQDVGDRHLFLSQFKQCVLDFDAQQWQTSVSNNTKLLCYSTYKSLLNVELYLKCIQSVVFKQALSRFRCSCHNLMIELGRRQGIDQEVRI